MLSSLPAPAIDSAQRIPNNTNQIPTRMDSHLAMSNRLRGFPTIAVIRYQQEWTVTLLCPTDSSRSKELPVQYITGGIAIGRQKKFTLQEDI
ncbi:uncharacterized protein LOC135101179 isoform X7 [Scylla paramamosain]|uniref:uncharacterized protein LOC135100094 isoform X7 n=1 Tax=Scylla paramamosain TaxID=85552 RepID=UPI003082CAD3